MHFNRCQPQQTTSSALDEPALSVGIEVLARPAWRAWLARWLALSPNATIMRRASPKFVPREWMLAAAYERAGPDTATKMSRNQSTAASGLLRDFSEIQRLQSLFRYPYDEQSLDMEKRYYHLPSSSAESQGGIGYMTRSS